MHIHYVSRGAWLHRSIFKLPSKWCIRKDVLTYSLGNREDKTQMHSYKCKHVYRKNEVAILAYFEQIGLEKH